MPNILPFRTDRPRPQQVADAPRGGARILFFTGVRYCREGAAPSGADAPGVMIRMSERSVDATTH